LADIFISYASKNRTKAAEIAALLASKGFSIWWDQNLTGGDRFRRSISKELYNSRIVIVIWTKDSISSDWVVSEASRAHEVGALLPLRDPDLPRRDVPPPFDNLHMDSADDHQRIVQAVESMIARRPGSIRQRSFGGEARYQILSWIGIMGGALTIFSSAGSLITLAKWAKIIADHWIGWTYQIWALAYELTGIRMSTSTQAATTFMLFLLAAAVSTDLQNRLLCFEQTPFFKFHQFKFLSILWASFFYIVHYHLHVWILINLLPSHVEVDYENGVKYNYIVLDFEPFAYFSAFVLIFSIARILTAGWPPRDAMSSSISIAFIGTFFFASAASRPEYDQSDSIFIDFLPIIIIGSLCRLISCSFYFKTRLWSIIAVLMLIAICNQIALMGNFND
jgi:hypothetical protein